MTRWIVAVVLAVLIVPFALVACGDSTPANNGATGTAGGAVGGLLPVTGSGASSNGRTPGTGPMSIGGAQWAEAKTLAGSLVQRIRAATIGASKLPDAMTVGARASEFCPALGIPDPKGEYFDGDNFVLTAVDPAARTYTISVTRGGIPGELTVNEKGRTTGP